MRKLIITALAILTATALFSIQYEEVLSVPYATNFAWLDYDRDGDEDVIITGNNVTNLYRNDGTAGFVDTRLTFAGFAEAEIHVADYNSDSYPDILISGYNTENYNPDYDPFPFSTTKVYTNNGGVGFTDATLPLLNVRDTQTAWFGSADSYYLVISSLNESNEHTVCYYTYQSYTNPDWQYRGIIAMPLPYVDYRCLVAKYDSVYYLFNGSSISYMFTISANSEYLEVTDLVMELPSEGFGGFEVLDFDSDNDQDIFIRRDSFSGSIVYENNNGVYSNVNYLFPGMDYDCTWVDYENDGDLDYVQYNLCYLQNDHSFSSVALQQPAWLDVGYKSIWYDINSDGLIDRVSIFYENYGYLAGHYFLINNGNYGFGWEYYSDMGLGHWRSINRNKRMIRDLDSDGDLDLSFIDLREWLGFSYYRLTGQPDLTEHTLDLFYSNGRIIPGDFDGDNDYDLLDRINVCVNINDYEYQLHPDDPSFGSSEIYGWVDYNQDGHLDFWRYQSWYPWSGIKIFINNGFGIFNETMSINVSLNGHELQNGSGLDWGDIDNDGDMDFVANWVYAGNYHGCTFIFYNNGNDNFVQNVLYEERSYTVDLIDYNNDGLLDVFLFGVFCWGNSYLKNALLYENKGNAEFELINTGIQPMATGKSAWGDYDNDGDLDIVIGGEYWDSENSVRRYITKMYRNDGSNGFTDINAQLPQIRLVSVNLGDIDNDGDLDIVLTGYNGNDQSNYNYKSDIYINTAGTFKNSCAGLFDQRYGGFGALFDNDNDGDLDILISGDSSPRWILYENNTSALNNPPTPPSITYDNQNGFSFSGSTDDTTPAIALTYDIRIGTTPGGSDVVCPMADLNTGFRKVVEFGRHAWGPMDLPGDQTYYASAQAIDNAYAGSAFGPEISFYVPPKPQLKLISSSSLDFAEQYIAYDSEPQSIVITNTGTAPLIISSLGYSLADSPFHVLPNAFPVTVAVGDSLILSVVFCPTNTSALSDTLSLPYNGAYYNNLHIVLTGTGIHVPPSVVGNVQLNMQDDSAHLSWSPVQSTIFDVPLAVDRYVVIFSEDPYENEHSFYYLGSTPDTTFVHPRVAIFRKHMFYKVKAVKFYDREQAAQFDNLIAGRNDLRWQDVVGFMDEVRNRRF